MKKLMPVLLALLVLLGVALPVSADVPDLEQAGSLRLSFFYDGLPLDGGKLTLYRVGDVAESDWNFSFELIPELADSNLTLEDPNDPELAQALTELTKAREIPGRKVATSQGVAEATDLHSGLYLITQSETETTKGFAPIAPFLISVPRMVDGEYETDVEANPKVPLTTEPPATTETTPPTDEKLPQTGQLWWPVPLLLSSGLGCMVMGFARRRQDET